MSGRTWKLGRCQSDERNMFVELKVSHASGKRRHGGLGVKVLFEGRKQLSRVRDEVGRKVPGRARKGLRTKNVSPQRTEGF